MAKLYNLARMTTATTGTGTITLGSAVSSYLSFADAGVQNGNTVTYAIVDGNNREVGRGVYTSSGTTLTRATILESTNSNAAINLSGNAEVFITAAAEDITSNVEITGGSITGITDLAIADGGTGASTASAAANNLDGYLAITASATPVSLTNTSSRTIFVTGNTSQTIVMPDVTTLALGWMFTITNVTSSSTVSFQSSGGNAFSGILANGNSARFTCIAITGTTTASWTVQFFGGTNRTGTGNVVYASGPSISTANLSNPTISQVAYSVSAITAGTNAQGQGSIAASTEVANVTTTANNPSGVTLPSGSSGFKKIVLNNGTNPIVVYPTTGQTINGLAANAGVTIPVGYAIEFTCSATGTWRTTSYGSQTFGTSGQVLTSAGASAAPFWSSSILAPTLTGTITEDIFAITDGAAFEVDPANGSIQTITLGASRTPKATNFQAGQGVTLMVDDGTAYTITWTDSTWGASGVKWVGGSAPTLATTGYTVIEFWKVGTQVYGALVGAA